MKIIKVFFKYLAQSWPTLVISVVLSFVLIRWIPGDPVMLLLGERGASAEAYAAMQKTLGLDQSFLSQFISYTQQLLQGNFGKSLLTHHYVWGEFWARFPATLELTFFAFTLALLVGVPMGAVAAVYHGSWLDRGVVGISVFGYSLPIFWWALILVLWVSQGLGLTPISGRIAVYYDLDVITGFNVIDSWFSDDPFGAFLSTCHHLILPAFVLSTVPMASIVRMTRSSMIDVFKSDYVRTAEAKGLKQLTVIRRHVLRNALIPIITTLGLLLSSMITGAILTESIFAWPGIGRWLIQSVLARDYPVVQASIVLISVAIVLINALVEALLAWANPRMRDQV